MNRGSTRSASLENSLALEGAIALL